MLNSRSVYSGCVPRPQGIRCRHGAGSPSSTSGGGDHIGRPLYIFKSCDICRSIAAFGGFYSQLTLGRSSRSGRSDAGDSGGKSIYFDVLDCRRDTASRGHSLPRARSMRQEDFGSRGHGRCSPSSFRRGGRLIGRPSNIFGFSDIG